MLQGRRPTDTGVIPYLGLLVLGAEMQLLIRIEGVVEKHCRRVERGHSTVREQSLSFQDVSAVAAVARGVWERGTPQCGAA